MGRYTKARSGLAVVLIVVLVLAAVAALVAFFMQTDIAVLSPKGSIAAEQRELILVASILGLFVVVPVFAMTFFIVWKYRETNKKPKKYSPDWDHSKLAESIWWGIPLAIIVILSVITWRSSHQLDPFKELAADQKPLTVQVVALQWKWLFIYPEHNIATVNFVQLPEDRPVTFKITSDAPMNSFWIPELGGQIYAMAGMTTKLHLLATEPGNYRGSSANISGEGFADMTFEARVTAAQAFEDWVKEAKASSAYLDTAGYEELALPSKNHGTKTYSGVEKTLYDTIVTKYLLPGLRPAETGSPRSHERPESIEPSVRSE